MPIALVRMADCVSGASCATPLIEAYCRSHRLIAAHGRGIAPSGPRSSAIMMPTRSSLGSSAAAAIDAAASRQGHGLA